jgi:hypothetical protein
MANQEVEVTVLDVNGECPHYKRGDKLVFKNQVFDPKWSTVDVFCVHSINDIYDEMIRLRREGKAGRSVRVPCMDNGIVTFEVKLTVSA